MKKKFLSARTTKELRLIANILGLEGNYYNKVKLIPLLVPYSYKQLKLAHNGKDTE